MVWETLQTALPELLRQLRAARRDVDEGSDGTEP
ncbi:hypothetical protein [Variovorax gracilis]